MKKNGFTLAELVVALGVIGIITALIVPAAHKLMPDNNKVLYLKAYDTISTTIDGLKNNSKLYPICSKDNIDCASHPLFSNRKPLLAPFNAANDDRFEGKTKLCNLLAFSFDDLNNANCKSDRYTYDASTFDNNVSFVSKNGMQWIVSPYEYSFDAANANFQTDIWVDINGSAEPNCIYSANCQKPDRFKFMVAADGTIVQADPKGIAYSNTRKTFTKNKADETINSTVIASTLSSTLASFTYGACGDVTQEEPGGEIPWDCINSATEADIQYINNVSTLCGLIFNPYNQEHNASGKYVEITLRYPAETELTYTPIASITYGYYGRRREVKGPSCTIPKGSTGCRINDQAIIDAAISQNQYGEAVIPTIRVQDAASPRMQTGNYNVDKTRYLSEPYEAVTSPMVDAKYFYGGGNPRDYVHYKMWESWWRT